MSKPRKKYRPRWVAKPVTLQLAIQGVAFPGVSQVPITVPELFDQVISRNSGGAVAAFSRATKATAVVVTVPPVPTVEITLPLMVHL